MLGEDEIFLTDEIRVRSTIDVTGLNHFWHNIILIFRGPLTVSGFLIYLFPLSYLFS